MTAEMWWHSTNILSNCMLFCLIIGLCILELVNSRSKTDFFFLCNSTTLFECIMYKQQINAHKYIIANNLVVDANALSIIFSVQLFAFYLFFSLKNSVHCNTFAVGEQLANVIFIINRLLLAWTVFFRVCKSSSVSYGKWRDERTFDFISLLFLTSIFVFVYFWPPQKLIYS